MGDSMSTIINATTTNGVVIQPDNSGSLVLQTNSGTTALTIDTSQRAAFVAGTAALPAITTTGDTNTGMFFPAADTIAFAEGGAEVMRIDSSGRVLIGTASSLASEKLGISFDGLTANAVVLQTTYASTGSAYTLFKNSAGANAGSITQNGTTTVAYTTSSDYRLKENIAPMTGALATIQALKPVTYKWKIDGSDGQGFIAHELAEIVPDCVVGEKDAVDTEGNPKYQGVDTSFLVATLTAAIKEQQTIINDLKARIETLEGAK
jgi:hypothetical protein